MPTKTDPQKIENLLTRSVAEIFPSRAFLEKRLKSGERLRLYVGIDPTAPDLHIGHGIQLRKLQQFQELGHEVILLIGDFTGMIGDPTDKSATRVQLTREQVLKNANKYQEQASRFLKFDGENPATIKYNSGWLAPMTLADVVELAAHFTVQQMLARDMFDRRLKEDKPIAVHEFLYPLMQGYDCVAMDVDGELGATDQLFNMLAGRTLMKEMKGKEKFVITTKLLVDATGKKMGKSEGNMIRLSDAPDEMFGKIMSWTDGMIVSGFELLTDVSMDEIREIEQQLLAGANPRDLKARLAREVVGIFYEKESAQAASDRFDQLFQQHELPEEIREVKIHEPISIIDALVLTGLVPSKSEARRLIDGKGIKVNSKIVESYELMIQPNDVIQKGKRFFVKVIA